MTRADDATSTTGSALSDPKARAMLALVIGLGLVIVVGIIVVLVTVANRLGGSGRDKAAVAEAGAFGTVDLAIPAGCEVVEMRPDGNRLVLRLGQAERCRQIVIVDLPTGRELGRVNLAPAQ